MTAQIIPFPTRAASPEGPLAEFETALEKTQEAAVEALGHRVPGYLAETLTLAALRKRREEIQGLPARSEAALRFDERVERLAREIERVLDDPRNEDERRMQAMLMGMRERKA